MTDQAENTTPRRQKYERNYLTSVIARIDFSPTFPVQQEKPPELPEAIRDQYPLSEFHLADQPQVSVANMEQGAEARFSVQRQLKWQFHTNDRSSYLEIAETSLLINFSVYEHFEQLLEAFLPVLEHVLGQLSDVQIGRVGLRYIDTFDFHDEPSPLDWSRYLVPELTAGISLVDDATTLSRAFNVLELNYGDGTNLRFQYGMPNPDYPHQIKRNFFVLDHDAYAANQELDADDVSGFLDRFHKTINSSFEQIITEELRKKMGIQDAT